MQHLPAGLYYTHFPKPHSNLGHGTNVVVLPAPFQAGLQPQSPAWEVGALTRRIKAKAPNINH